MLVISRHRSTSTSNTSRIEWTRHELPLPSSFWHPGSLAPSPWIPAIACSELALALCITVFLLCSLRFAVMPSYLGNGCAKVSANCCTSNSTSFLSRRACEPIVTSWRCTCGAEELIQSISFERVLQCSEQCSEPGQTYATCNMIRLTSAQNVQSHSCDPGSSLQSESREIVSKQFATCCEDLRGKFVLTSATALHGWRMLCHGRQQRPYTALSNGQCGHTCTQ